MPKEKLSDQAAELVRLVQKKKALIFDFDGVLADSVEVKTAAFAELYKPYGQTVMKQVIDHHRANGGMSRFEKFRHYHPEFLGKEINDEKVDRLSREFSIMVVNKVINSPEIPGATGFLEKYCKEKICCVNSGTPEVEIREIVRKRRWDHFFQKVYGSPETKFNNLNKIVEAYSGLNENDFLFFGDALSDLNAAVKAGIDFIGIGHFQNSILAGEVSGDRLIEDFSCLINE